MIKLQRPACPSQLTSDEVQKLTSAFIADSTSRVWDKQYIKDTLRQLSHQKCCYCEVDVSEESKYMEVEHYKCKTSYPHEVVSWGNLLPSCKRCNAEKGNYDVAAGLIIDPTVMEPKNHLYLRDNYRFRHRDEIGKSTIEEVYLNDSDRLVRVRFRIGESIHDALTKIKCDLAKLLIDPENRNHQKKVLRAILALLAEANPISAFSGTAATCIIRDLDYTEMRSDLINLNLWTQELESAHNIASSSSLHE